MSESFGMMDGAYFVSKQVIFDWVNDMLKLNVSRVQEFGTGAIYCQIFDVMFPGKIKLKRVKWKAKYEHEYVHNLKLLQQGFLKAKVKKWIDVPKLCKARPLDNLEMAQWFKQFFDNRGTTCPEDYDPVAARGGTEVLFGKFIKRQKYQDNYKNNAKDYSGKNKKSKMNVQSRLGLDQIKKKYKGSKMEEEKNQLDRKSKRNSRGVKTTGVKQRKFKPMKTLSQVKKELAEHEDLVKQIKKIAQVQSQDSFQQLQQIRSLLGISLDYNKENSNFPQTKQLNVNPAQMPQDQFMSKFNQGGQMQDDQNVHVAQVSLEDDMMHNEEEYQ